MKREVNSQRVQLETKNHVKDSRNSNVNNRKQNSRKSSINVLTIKKEEIISLAGGQSLGTHQQFNTPEPDTEMQNIPKQSPNPSLIKRKSQKAYLEK